MVERDVGESVVRVRNYFTAASFLSDRRATVSAGGAEEDAGRRSIVLFVVSEEARPETRLFGLLLNRRSRAR